jgi:cysteine desulfurase/selenocysteine lyase
MDFNKIRQDFPILQEAPGKKPVIYLDTACQSLRPTQVIDAVASYYTRLSACSGRSQHRLGVETERAVAQARDAVAKFIGAARKEEIVFTRNTTEGINLVANSLDLKPGDRVVLPDKEHNSNLIPWQWMARKKGIEVVILPSLPDNTFDVEAYGRLFDRPVRLVALGATSNLDGVTIPLEPVVKKAHQNGALVLLDAAQAAPHMRLNMKSLDADFLAFSGHKLLGPSGTGVLYGKFALLEKLEPFLVGGDTVGNSTYTSCEFLPPPEKFEAGLQDYGGIIGLGAAVEYLQKIGFDAIQKQERLLNEMVTNELKSLPGLRIIGPQSAQLRNGVFTFTIDGIDSHRIALMLDQMAGIAVRSGMHCVHSWFNARGLKGAARASFYFYNSQDDAAALIAALQKIRKVL